MSTREIPRPVSDALAEFLEHRCREELSAREPQGPYGVASKLAFVHGYRRACLDRHDITSENMAWVLLEMSLNYRQHPHFDPRWLQWLPTRHDQTTRARY